MRIKGKILVIIAISCVSFFLAGLFVLNFVFMGYVKTQEQKDINNKCGSLLTYLHNELASLESTNNDWAKWDATYYFISSKSNDYIEENLNEESVANLRLSFMIYADTDGNNVYRLYLDNQTGSFIDFPAMLQQDVEDGLGVKGMRFPGNELSGVICSSGKYYLVSGTSTTDSMMNGPANGSLVIGREIDEGSTAIMEKIAGGKIGLHKAGDLDGATALALAAQPEGGQAVPVIKPVDNDSIVAFVPLGGSGGVAQVVAGLVETRDVYQSGVVQFRVMALLFLALMLLIMFILFKTLDVYISRPVEKLAAGLSDIRHSGSSFKRLDCDGKGELPQLGRTINSMLDNIESNMKEIGAKEDQFVSLVDGMNQGFALYEAVLDDAGKLTDCRYLYVNRVYLEASGQAASPVGKTLLELYPENGKLWLGFFGSVALDGKPVHKERQIAGRYMELNAYRPRPMQIATLISDVTEQRLIAEEREYASYHDQLTELYNRRYFDEAMLRLDTPENLPLSVVIADLNGLKFTNDAFGHATGDKLLVAVAGVLKEICRSGDIIARWGGDEFTILLPRTSLQEVGAICSGIKESVSKIEINSMRYSVSLGYDTKRTEDESLQAVLRHAEDFMYRRKATENHGRGHAIQAILTTFNEKNQREKEHSDRVSFLCKLLGRAAGLSEEQVEDLGIAGLAHDIGKIAINDAIINKTSRLTAEEWTELKRHPEIGYRILCASNEMTEIADYILAHHERWDGSGYPKGLAGTEIPLQARILAIADSYDAITSDRPYKQKMEEQEAVREIAHCSGSQFDPALARVFVENVLGYGWDDLRSRMGA